MWAGHQWNDRIHFMLAKLATAAIFLTVFFRLEWPLVGLFSAANTILQTEWIAREWAFRVSLDLYIPFWGMLSALLYIKVLEHKITEQPWWPRLRRAAIIVSALSALAFTTFALAHGKREYNLYHPYISTVPIIAFAVLRNATSHLRSTSSRFYIYFGQCSLETFVIQVNVLDLLHCRIDGLMLYCSFIYGSRLIPKAYWS